MPDTQTSLRLSKTIDDIRAGLFARIEQVQDEYAAKGWLPGRLNLNKGVVRGLIELFAWGLWQLYQLLETVHRQAVPLDATGDWLSLHASQIGETRKAATKAVGNILFLRSETASGNIRIPAGRIVRTRTDGEGNVYRYVTTAVAVLPEGQTSVAVPVEAEEYGAASNAAQGQICELATPVPGIGGVTNVADWLTGEGADDESDLALQKRYVLAWQAQAGITRAAYEAAALSVPGVSGVYVADRHPRGEGTVDVVVRGSAGLPTAQLLKAVREALDSRIAINHDLLVKAPTPVTVDINMTLELLTGNPDVLRADAELFITRVFSGADSVPALNIGDDVIRDRLASGIVNLSGVKRIVWSSSSGDVNIGPGELAVLGTLTVRTQWVDEA